MATTLMFWRAGPRVTLSAGEIGRELTWGEEVEGLIDLPVKEILGRLKDAFPRSRETPGLLTIHAATGHCEATWSWQHMRLECHELAPSDQERLAEILAEFGCTAYEA